LEGNFHARFFDTLIVRAWIPHSTRKPASMEQIRS
jgi:hypothetical protein